MPVEFLTDDEAAAYGRYREDPSQADLERVFFLDDEDMALVNQHRGEHMRAGFALQLVTVRWLGTFLDSPLDVPPAVLVPPVSVHAWVSRCRLSYWKHCRSVSPPY